MNETKLAKTLTKITERPDPETFVYELLRAYKLPKATITLLQKGDRNTAAAPGQVGLKRKLWFRELKTDEEPWQVLEEVRGSLRHQERFVILTDYDILLAWDTVTEEALDIDLVELPKHYDFFFPWAGIEKTRHRDENPADVKAASRMARLYDLIKKDNPREDEHFVHELNVFLSRLLFCYFAEDTGIFPGDNLFTNGIGSQTKNDGSNLHNYFTELFNVLDCPVKERRHYRDHFLAFPYVNGGLFRHAISVPNFSARSRRAIISAGSLDWAAINPDIFGSMIQAVITPEHRGGLGMHYTSVPNIMKVIEPLFLDELRAEYDKARDSRTKLERLHERLSKIKIFDPACGSGNFLIIAYKELRELEMRIIKRHDELGKGGAAGATLWGLGAGYQSKIKLSQFYGIELDDFAHEIAILALWLAEHQMNLRFKEVFGQAQPTLPLDEQGHIVHGNACRLDWEEVCPKEEGWEVFILGNPPYLGAKIQNSGHKADLATTFATVKKYKDLDLIAAWFYKAALYVKGNISKAAFVSTNSICQGQQVELLWPNIFNKDVAIEFAYESFVWKNNAKQNAGVVVVIVGLSSSDNIKLRRIYKGNSFEYVDNINAYLVNGANKIVSKSTRPISELPSMSFGNMPNDGGGLILSENERLRFLASYPQHSSLVKELAGASEFIKGNTRYCLWIKTSQLDLLKNVDFVVERIKKTRKHRLESSDVGTNKLAERSHQFRDLNTATKQTIIIPRVSSMRRDYIPIGIVQADVIVADSAQSIYDGKTFIMGVVSSRIHMTWMRAVAGRLKFDYRYSKNLVYNTFPFPKITPEQEAELEQTAEGILLARAAHPGATLAELYDPDKMPENLREAHRANDLAVERCYRAEPFESDEERLAWLFRLYEEMTAAEVGA